MPRSRLRRALPGQDGARHRTAFGLFCRTVSKQTPHCVILDGHCAGPLVCPLSRVKAGVAVRIKQLCASPELQNRLRELGLGEDQIIRLLTSQTNFICQVCNARLAISEQLAQLILVEPLRSTVV